MKIMIAKDDVSGLPRAWAFGPPGKEQETREHAEAQLQRYIAKRNALGEGLQASDFTERTAPLYERGDLVVISFGGFGLQVAFVVEHLNHQLRVRKWRRHSQRWTETVKVSLGAVHRIATESDLREFKVGTLP